MEREVINTAVQEFAWKNKAGKKPKLYMVLDCETATLPFVSEWKLSADDKKKIAIAKPIIYDIAWQIVDRVGRVYAQHSYLVQESFFVPNIFNTGYYREKRPMYMKKLEEGTVITQNWEYIMEKLIADMERVEFVGAYNSMFDFKKAIPFTDTYFAHLYGADYQKWEDSQKRVCKAILSEKKWENPDEFDNMNFECRGVNYPMIDLWGLSCTMLINEDIYRVKCLQHAMISPSGLFFKTSAETTFRFLLNDYSFNEDPPYGINLLIPAADGQFHIK